MWKMLLRGKKAASASAALKILAAVLFLLTIEGRAQQSAMEPRQPRWGDTVTVTCHPSSKQSSGFNLTVEMIFPNGSHFRSFSMRGSGDGFVTGFTIPEGLSAMRLHFISSDGVWEQGAFISTMVLRSDGKAARGAHQSRISGSDYNESFKQEISIYPDNYSAYRDRWSIALEIEGEKAGRMISSEMARLGRIKPRTAELASVLSFGHTVFSEPDKSIELIRRLVDQYPENPFTARAIADYELRHGDREKERDGGRELRSWKRAVIARSPGSEGSRRILTEISGDADFPIDLSEKVAEEWMREQPGNPLAPYHFARALSAHYSRHERALELIERAVDLLIAGRLRLFGDISGRQTPSMTGNAYLIRADLLLRTGKYDSALTAVRLAKTFDLDPRHAAHLLEARILWAAGRRDAAESAYLEAFRRGSQEALERLRGAYAEKTGRRDGFDSWLASLQTRAEVDGRIAIEKRPLPTFRAIALDGSTVDLNGLQGKIVVINLWFIACGPCRKEIPALNDLVAEFSGRDVVFLAISPDSAAALRDFLGLMPFNYRIVPNAESLIQGVFQATLFPTHLVLNREGQIEAAFIGGGSDRPSEVRRELMRLLNSK